MRRSLLLLLLLAACNHNTDQRVRCTDAAESNLPGSAQREQFVEQCVTHGWSTKQMTCHARNAGLLGAFCDD